MAHLSEVISMINLCMEYRCEDFLHVRMVDGLSIAIVDEHHLRKVRDVIPLSAWLHFMDSYVYSK